MNPTTPPRVPEYHQGDVIWSRTMIEKRNLKLKHQQLLFLLLPLLLMLPLLLLLLLLLSLRQGKIDHRTGANLITRGLGQFLQF